MKQVSNKNEYRGTILEESLVDPSVLEEVRILKTEVEKVTPEHHTPHLKQWTLHTVEIPERDVQKVAEHIRQSIDVAHNH